MLFSFCEASLAGNGHGLAGHNTLLLLYENIRKTFHVALTVYTVLTITVIPEERYSEYRLSSDFVKEYIFPGSGIPSLARITSAMSLSSRLW